MIQVTRAEVCAVACAELFRGAGEIMVSPRESPGEDRVRGKCGPHAVDQRLLPVHNAYQSITSTPESRQ